MRPVIFQMACLLALLGACHGPPARSAEYRALSRPPTPAATAQRPPVGAWVILDAQSGPAIVNYCVRVLPAETSNFVPTSAQVEEADAALARGLAEVGLSIAYYNRQYTGVFFQLRSLVYVSAAPTEISYSGYAGSKWRDTPFQVCDGGRAFFQGAYDPALHAFAGFGFGAMAEPSAEEDLFVKVCGRQLQRDSDVCDPVTPVNTGDWREVARRYFEVLDGRRILAPCTVLVAGQCLDAGWGARNAPTAAFRGAFAFKQLGDYPSAVKMYERFIVGYGDDELLATLQHGSAEQVEEYRERLRFLQSAYNELSIAHVASFDFAAAAADYERGARNTRLALAEREQMLKSAMTLFRWLGDRAGLRNAYTLVKDLELTPAEKAALDALVAK